MADAAFKFVFVQTIAAAVLLLLLLLQCSGTGHKSCNLADWHFKLLHPVAESGYAAFWLTMLRFSFVLCQKLKHCIGSLLSVIWFTSRLLSGKVSCKSRKSLDVLFHQLHAQVGSFMMGSEQKGPPPVVKQVRQVRW